MLQGEYNNNIVKVVQWITADLAGRFPRAQAELFIESNGNAPARVQRGNLDRLLAEFERYCCSFPGGWVSYQPEHPYGCAVKIIGHCGKHGTACDTRCENYRARPKVTLLLRSVNDGEVLVGHFFPPEKAIVSKPGGATGWPVVDPLMV